MSEQEQVIEQGNPAQMIDEEEFDRHLARLAGEEDDDQVEVVVQGTEDSEDDVSGGQPDEEHSAEAVEDQVEPEADGDHEAEEAAETEEATEEGETPQVDEIERLRRELEIQKRIAARASGNASRAMSELSKIKERSGAVGDSESGALPPLPGLDPEKLEEIKEDYGLDLGAVIGGLTKQQMEIARKQQEEIARLKQEIEVQRVVNAVSARHPDIDVTKLADDEQFVQWRDSLPPEERAFVVSTNDPEDIVVILDRYKHDTGMAQESKPQVSRENFARKQRRAKSAVGVKGRSVASRVDAGDLKDRVAEDAIWDEVMQRHGFLR